MPSVDPKGCLLKASFNADSEEWSDPSYLVYGEMGPGAKSPSKLAASAVDDNLTDLLWVTASGRVHGERTTDDDLYGQIYGFWDEGVDAVNAAPTSALATLVTARVGTRLWWITPQESIQMAVRPGGRNDKNKWHISIVAGPKSAATNSDLAAVSISPDDLRIWWFNPANKLMCARALSTTELKPQWSFVDSMPVVESRTESRQTLVAHAIDLSEGARGVQVWYVGKDNKANSLTWEANPKAVNAAPNSNRSTTDDWIPE
ncbi:hypothetical protein H072_501 [Dactylellina haptotyla CBS 200.50]|uniref:Fucose-specific lectin n=1 Tax=Dactylellina haptotyla (strain CBS 200.50) TaxID=1284197 RepID=S8AR84_DACHA|nr:hypothetical protein H072_501 [Dactylellina haptotyla CBS 200.50]